MAKLYKNIGIGLLIACALLLASGFLRHLVTIITVPGYFSLVMQTISAGGGYPYFLFYLLMALETLLYIWGIVLAIAMIKRDKYNKQLLWWVYAVAGIKALTFVLYLIAGSFDYVNLAIAILIFWFLIKSDNEWSRVIKKKGK